MSKLNLKLALVVAIAVLFLAYSVKAQTGYTIEKCNLKVYPEGYVLVSMYIKLPEEAYSINVSLIGEPNPDYIIFVLDEHGDFLAYELRNNIMEIFTVDSRAVNVTYITASLTSKEKDVWVLEANLPVDSEITLPEKSLIVELSEVPLLIDTRGEAPVLAMPKGHVRIGYIIPPSITPPVFNQTQQEQPKTNQTEQLQVNQTETIQTGESPAGQENAPTQESPSKPEAGVSQTGGGSQPEKSFEIPTFYIIALPLVAIPIVLFLLLRIRRKELSEELRYEEIEILNALRALGGQAFQSEVARIVDQPSTTLWRNIRRLEEKGYVRVEKKFGRNFLTLLKF